MFKVFWKTDFCSHLTSVGTFSTRDFQSERFDGLSSVASSSIVTPSTGQYFNALWRSYERPGWNCCWSKRFAQVCQGERWCWTLFFSNWSSRSTPVRMITAFDASFCSRSDGSSQEQPCFGVWRRCITSWTGNHVVWHEWPGAVCQQKHKPLVVPATPLSLPAATLSTWGILTGAWLNFFKPARCWALWWSPTPRLCMTHTTVSPWSPTWLTGGQALKSGWSTSRLVPWVAPCDRRQVTGNLPMVSLRPVWGKPWLTNFATRRSSDEPGYVAAKKNENPRRETWRAGIFNEDSQAEALNECQEAKEWLPTWECQSPENDPAPAEGDLTAELFADEEFKMNEEHAWRCSVWLGATECQGSWECLLRAVLCSCQVCQRPARMPWRHCECAHVPREVYVQDTDYFAWGSLEMHTCFPTPSRHIWEGHKSQTTRAQVEQLKIQLVEVDDDTWFLISAKVWAFLRRCGLRNCPGWPWWPCRALAQQEKYFRLFCVSWCLHPSGTWPMIGLPGGNM